MAIQFFNSSNKRKLTEALDTLSEAAREKRESVQDTLADFTKKSQKEMKKVNKEVHTNPWVYIGAAAAAALLLGFVFGRSSKKERWER